MDNLDLCDIWRVRNPETSKFSWRTFNPVVERRLDFFLVSASIQPFVCDADIIGSVSTDHSTITLHLSSTEGNCNGPSYWRFNTSLLQDANYMSNEKSNIQEWKNEFHETENPMVKWEYLKYKI